MLRTVFAGASLACLLALPQVGLAQTAAEQLQKGIFAEQAQGKLDDAITIYRQLANSALPQRDVAAQAQYRLALALLQKGDLTGASVEMQRLAQNYADYRTLISGLAARASHAGVLAPGVAAAVALPGQAQSPPPNLTTFDRGAYVTATGKIVQVLWVNPWASIAIDAGAGQFYSFAITSPNTMMRMGMTRNTFVAGMMVTVSGNLADDGQKRALSLTLPTGEKIEGSAVVARANTVLTQEDGKVVFDRQKVPPPVPPVVVGPK